MSDPAIKTKQFRHQEETYLAHRDDEFYALFWEMGLGKTKVMLDVASHLHLNDKIDALLVIAPNCVYKNWLSQEIPVHLATEYMGMAYPKSDSERDRVRKLVFLDPDFQPDRLRVLCISYDSIGTQRGIDFIKKMLTIYRVMTVADESTAIKTPKSKRTKRTKTIGKLSEYRWIATGTPVAQSPFDIHSQVEFMTPDFWAGYGMKTMRAFKNEFGEFVMRRVGHRQFPELKSYRRLSVLQKLLKPISSRLLKEDSEIDLPPKTYAVRTFELTPGQRELYDTVRDAYEADLDDGLRIEAPLAIVRLARLQQITSGFVTAEELVEDCEAIDEGTDQLRAFQIERRIEDIVSNADNPKLKLLVELLDQCSHKVIVWCRFRRDVDNIMGTIKERGIRYDGMVNAKNRDIALERFRNADDPAQVLVVNICTINQGVTLTIAKTMIYYSNHFSLEKRLQSEDRNHRIGQDSPVLIIDIAGEQTVDEKIIKRLRDKFDIASQVTGDRFREWITLDGANE